MLFHRSRHRHALAYREDGLSPLALRTQFLFGLPTKATHFFLTQTNDTPLSMMPSLVIDTFPMLVAIYFGWARQDTLCLRVKFRKLSGSQRAIILEELCLSQFLGIASEFLISFRNSSYISILLEEIISQFPFDLNISATISSQITLFTSFLSDSLSTSQTIGCETSHVQNPLPSHRIQDSMLNHTAQSGV